MLELSMCGHFSHSMPNSRRIVFYAFPTFVAHPSMIGTSQRSARASRSGRRKCRFAFLRKRRIGDVACIPIKHCSKFLCRQHLNCTRFLVFLLITLLVKATQHPRGFVKLQAQALRLFSCWIHRRNSTQAAIVQLERAQG